MRDGVIARLRPCLSAARHNKRTIKERWTVEFRYPKNPRR